MSGSRSITSTPTNAQLMNDSSNNNTVNQYITISQEIETSYADCNNITSMITLYCEQNNEHVLLTYVDLLTLSAAESATVAQQQNARTPLQKQSSTNTIQTPQTNNTNNTGSNNTNYNNNSPTDVNKNTNNKNKEAYTNSTIMTPRSLLKTSTVDNKENIALFHKYIDIAANHILHKLAGHLTSIVDSTNKNSTGNNKDNGVISVVDKSIKKNKKSKKDTSLDINAGVDANIDNNTTDSTTTENNNAATAISEQHNNLLYELIIRKLTTFLSLKPDEQISLYALIKQFVNLNAILILTNQTSESNNDDDNVNVDKNSNIDNKNIECENNSNNDKFNFTKSRVVQILTIYKYMDSLWSSIRFVRLLCHLIYFHAFLFVMWYRSSYGYCRCSKV